MLGNIFGWLVLVGVTVVLGWLAFRAWRTRNAILKWGGVVLSGLLTLVFALLSVFGGVGLYKLYVPRGNPIQNIKVAGTPEQIKRGERLAYGFCATCHSVSGELPLSGGRDAGQDSPVPIGTFVSINLTPAGPLKDWSDGEIFRTLREGVDRDGRFLLIMSAMSSRYMSDEDLQAVIAFLRSQPPVPTETPSGDSPNLLLPIFLGAGLIPQPPPVTEPITAPSPGPTADYGGYIVRYEGCSTCHGSDLSGGTGGLVPVGPNLRVVQGWTREQFVATIRTGADPGGHALSDQMPWKDYARLDDEELSALYAYLKSLPAVKNEITILRERTGTATLPRGDCSGCATLCVTMSETTFRDKLL